tara:strand:- start:18633 stop:19850 length:1218 start_codon:yes stop_codon:yes gene_type:complete
MSGFEKSLECKRWEPTGSPAMAHLIEHLDVDKAVDLTLVMTRSYGSVVDGSRLAELNNCNVSLQGLGTNIRVLSDKCPLIFPRKLRFLWVEVLHFLRIFCLVRQINPDLIYIDRSNWLIAGLLARLTQRPVFLRLLGIPPDMWRLDRSKALFNWVMKWAYRSCFAYVLCSQDGSGGKEWMDRYLAKSTPRSIMLNGVNQSNWSDYRDCFSCEAPVNVVLLGRVEKLKGADFFVDALLSVPPAQRKLFKPTIVGDGEALQDLVAKVQEAQCDDWVDFSGSLTLIDVEAVLGSADVYVSLNLQGHLSNSTLEAISFGIPCIVRRLDGNEDPLGGIGHVLEKGARAEISCNAQPSELASLLINLCSDPKKIKSMREVVKISRDHKLMPWSQRIAVEMDLIHSVANQGL